MKLENDTQGSLLRGGHDMPEMVKLASTFNSY